MNAARFRHRKQQPKIAFILFVLIAIITQGNLFGFDEEIFPVPDNIKSNVKFWINTYTLYNSSQIIIHDSENLEIVYEILDLNEFFGGTEFSEKQKWDEAERVKKKYREILINLAQLKEIDPESLNARERYVYNLFLTNASPKNFRRAIDNIRAQQGLRDLFRDGLIRSGLYATHIDSILKKYNLPSELIALPYVESLFNYKANSKVGAAGMWQFTRRTGRLFLDINYTVDERFDPIKSTEAAVRFLKENYETLGNWPLAITAYNHGVQGMKRAVNTLKTKDLGEIIDNYESRSFKFASRNFYAEFLAACEVHQNYREYFGEIEFKKPLKYMVFKLPNYVKISTLSKKLGISINEIHSYNPELRKSVVQSIRRLPKGFHLKLPHLEGFDPTLAYAEIPNEEKFKQQLSTDWYQIERGDNLDLIARRFGTSVDEILFLNDIKKPDQIYVGEVIRIKSEITKAENGLAQKSSEDIVEPKIKPADQTVNKMTKYLTDDAQLGPLGADGVSENHDLITDNFSDNIWKNYLNNRPASSAPTENVTQEEIPLDGTVTIQPDETLGHLADWLNIPTQELRQLNGLRFGQKIELAQKIKVTYRNTTRNEFKQKRLEYRRAIEEDFFAVYQVDGISIHKVRAGENIWLLCNETFDIPYWLVVKYNPDTDLLNLNVDDLLVVPNIEKKNETAG